MEQYLKHFDWEYYLNKYSDLSKKYNNEKDAKIHFYSTENPTINSIGPGMQEGRLFNPLLEELLKYGYQKYISENLELQNKSRYDVFIHYLNEKNKPLMYISIGNVCNSAVYCVKNKLRPSKKEGYKTCPFDLMVSNIDGIIQCLNNDFKDFCDPKYLKFTDPNLLIHTKYNFSFNHEVPINGDGINNPIVEIYEKEKWLEGPQHFINNNFKNFIERYTNRINNFRNYCKTHNVTFVLEYYYDKKDDKKLNELKKSISNRFPKLNFEILII